MTRESFGGHRATRRDATRFLRDRSRPRSTIYTVNPPGDSNYERVKTRAAAGELKGGTIEAMDGDIGSVQDLYFDDQTWTVRYVVVDTGTWLPGRHVLVSPFAFQPVPGAARLRTSLTKKQIENSPSVDTDYPVNRQREVEFSQYYDYPYYWVGPYRWGDLAYPGCRSSRRSRVRPSRRH